MISTSTPAGRSSFISASTVLSVGSMMSISRRCVRISSWSREVLSTCGERSRSKRCLARRQRHRAAHDRARALGRVDDLERRLVDQPVVERLEANADSLALHVRYSMTLATTPAPTVLPPSRMAKRRPCSIAIGVISVTTILMLSPGITISVPLGSSTAPVTSVVRK